MLASKLDIWTPLDGHQCFIHRSFAVFVETGYGIRAREEAGSHVR